MIEQSKHYALAITCGAKRGPKDTDLTFSPSSLRDFLKALAEQPAQQDMPKIGCVNHDCDKCKKAQRQEPVAWMVDVDLANYQGQSEYRTILSWNAKPVWSGTHEINEVLKAVPLYTSPPAQRKPLTDDQIDRAIAELGLNYFADAANNRAVLRELCRKAAHGITKGNT